MIFGNIARFVGSLFLTAGKTLLPSSRASLPCGYLALLALILFGLSGCNGIGDSYDARMAKPHQNVTQAASEEGERETEETTDGEAAEGETAAETPDESKEATK